MIVTKTPSKLIFCDWCFKRIFYGSDKIEVVVKKFVDTTKYNLKTKIIGRYHTDCYFLMLEKIESCDKNEDEK